MNEYSFPHTKKGPNEINLTGFMREFLLLEICRRIDIIDYCEYFMNFKLTPGSKNSYKGKCPWCGKNTFTVNKTTGLCSCSSCSRDDDFLTLASCNLKCHLNYTLHFLKGYIRSTEKSSNDKKGISHETH